jgi:hypothetical protein
MGTLPASPTTALRLVPGRLLVLFFVQLDHAAPACLAVPPAGFFDGLRAAAAMLGFHGLQRAEPALDELLPWAGNV